MVRFAELMGERIYLNVSFHEPDVKVILWGLNIKVSAKVRFLEFSFVDITMVLPRSKMVFKRSNLQELMGGINSTRI